jgi:hypothetical protein
VTDISDLFSSYSSRGEELVNDPDRGETILHLRRAISGTTLRERHPNIWYNNNTDCRPDLMGTCFPVSEYYGGRYTLASSADTKHVPFVSQLESNFNTGLIRQFAPRFNSTVSVNSTNTVEFPKNCASIPGAFYAEYKGQWNQYPVQEYNARVCMLMNQTLPFLQNIRARQDFEELLYLDIDVQETGYLRPSSPSATFKIVASTTFGYFELPNYWNNNTAGQVLADDPNNHCDSYCMNQGRFSWNSIINHTK